MTAEIQILEMTAAFEKQLQEKFKNPLLRVKIFGVHGMDMDYVVNMVAELANVSPSSMLSKKRGHQDVSDARMVAIAICREYLNLGYTTIGKHFRRHHSTVIHAETTISHRVQARDEFVCNIINKAVKQIKEITDLTTLT